MQNKHEYSNEAPSDNRNGLVYVIDDDADVRESIKWLLESTNYRVKDFESGETFIAQFDEDVPCVVLCDLRMPGMSGAEVQDHLLHRRPSTPFIFITGHGDVTQAVQAFKMGAMDFIQKPFQQAQLQELVDRAMRTAKEVFERNRELRTNRSLIEKLTPREQQVLDRIVNGRLNKQIADDLGISIKTVEAHRASIMDKTGSGTVADLMRVVVKSELFPQISATLAEAVAGWPSFIGEAGLPHTKDREVFDELFSKKNQKVLAESVPLPEELKTFNVMGSGGNSNTSGNNTGNSGSTGSSSF